MSDKLEAAYEELKQEGERLYWFFRMIDSGGYDAMSDLDNAVYDAARLAASWFEEGLDPPHTALTEEEAVRGERPEHGPWEWSPAILAAVSNIADVTPDHMPATGTIGALFLAERMLKNLYGNGYALVRKEQGNAEW